MKPAARVLALVLALPVHGQEAPRKPQETPPVSAPVVGHVNLESYIEQRARLISVEAQLKECERRRLRKHFLARLLGAIFGRR
jgi:hypothetical protein